MEFNGIAGFKTNNIVLRAILSAKKEAFNHKNNLVSDEYILFTVYKEIQHHAVGKLMKKHHLDIFTLRYYLDNKRDNTDNEFIAESPEDIFLSDESLYTLEQAQQYADSIESEEIEQHCLILALLHTNNNVIHKYIEHYDVDVEALIKDIVMLMMSKSDKPNSKKDNVSKQEIKADTKIIEELCVDLTQQALDGKIDPIIGREREMEAIINTMARRTKNNVLLVSDPGCGKHAL